jgi:hypothetical protein
MIHNNETSSFGAHILYEPNVATNLWHPHWWCHEYMLLITFIVIKYYYMKLPKGFYDQMTNFMLFQMTIKA